MVRAVGVWPAAAADLDVVMELLREARDWQRARGVDVWREFDRGQISADICAGRVYIAKERATEQGAVRGAVTLVESDPLVWGPDDGEALYVHRLVSSRQAAGRGTGAMLIRWARFVAAWRCKRWLRLETWNENRAMRGYYENQGFRHVRDQWYPFDSSLPADYRGTTKSLYQIEL